MLSLSLELLSFFDLMGCEQSSTAGIAFHPVGADTSTVAQVAFPVGSLE